MQKTHTGTAKVNDSKTLFCPRCATNHPVSCMSCYLSFYDTRIEFLRKETNVLDGKVWIAVVSTSRIPIYHRLLFKRELRRVWKQRKAHGGLINQSEQGGR